MSWLPNRDGYRFIGIKHDGTRHDCTVKLVLGVYVVDIAPVTQFKEWLPMPVKRP